MPNDVGSCLCTHTHWL